MLAPLQGRICVVTGASRGIGKGIALQLGEAGATVYITGRTVDSHENSKAGSLEQTAKEIGQRGGTCVIVQCDHSKDEDVKALFEKVCKEQNGRLDLLVNNVYSAVLAIGENENKRFWETPVSFWDEVNHVGLRNHYICSVYAAQMMVPQKHGLIVNISSPGGISYIFNVPYGVGKEACDRMAVDCAHELKIHNVAFVSLWPGYVKTETIHKVLLDPEVVKLLSPARKKFAEMFQEGETPEFSGKCIVRLLQDPHLMQKSGRVLITGDLGEEYHFTDITGEKPIHLRSINLLLRHAGYTRLAKFIPSWVKIPNWLLVFSLQRF